MRALAAGRWLLGVAPAAVVAVFAGCGSSGSPEAVSPGSPPTAGGTLRIAMAANPHTLDPLLARRTEEQLVARQVYEPLVAQLEGPYGAVRRVPGLVTSTEAAGQRGILEVRPRQDVALSDGGRVNATAVLANAQRWRDSPRGSSL